MKTFIISTLFSSFIFLNTILPVQAVPYVPQDDNGDASFVRQVLPKLLGRKPKGTLEVSLLTDIIKLHGREALLRSLMERPEFNKHWTANIIDHLEMQRRHSRSQSKTCFSESAGIDGKIQVIGDAPETLAKFVRDNAITAKFPTEFTMTELIDSAISLDNLYPVYRAYLFPLAAKRSQPSSMSSAADIRATIGSHFDRVYLNRDMECMGCHRGTYSTTGVWDRTHPLYQSLDLAVFDQKKLGEYQADINDYPAEHPYKVCAGCHGDYGTGDTAGGIIDSTVSKIKSALGSESLMLSLQASFQDGDDGDDGDTWNEEKLAEIADFLKDRGSFGINNIGTTAEKHYAVFRRDLFPIDSDGDDDIDETGYDFGWSAWGMDKSCGIIAYNFKNISDGPEAAFFAGTELANRASILQVDASLQQGYADLYNMVGSMQVIDSDGTNGAVSLDGNVALSYMLAAKITGNIWEQLMGQPLTIVNQFARNAQQRSLHQYLTEEVFINNDWSIKDTIVAIFTSPYFNRQTPVSSSADNVYTLPAVLDPFSTVTLYCPTDNSNGDDHNLDSITIAGTNRNTDTLEPYFPTWCKLNSQGDVVHRYSARDLISAVGEALNWPEDKLLFGSESQNTDYPSLKLNLGIGQYATEIDPGFKEVSFQSLLIWDETYGTCATPSNSDNKDWLFKFREQIDTYNSANPETPLTLGDIVLTLKDWLIQEPVFGGYKKVQDEPTVPDPEPIDDTILSPDIPTVPPFPVQPSFQVDLDEPSETELIAKLFNMDSIDNPVSTESVNEEKLRQLCGVYLRSPQFMMAGLVRNDELNPPRFRVCNDGICSYREMCENYRSALTSVGYATVCGVDSVSKPLTKVLKITFKKTEKNTTLINPNKSKLSR